MGGNNERYPYAQSENSISFCMRKCSYAKVVWESAIIGTNGLAVFDWMQSCGNAILVNYQKPFMLLMSLESCSHLKRNYCSINSFNPTICANECGNSNIRKFDIRNLPKKTYFLWILHQQQAMRSIIEYGMLSWIRHKNSEFPQTLQVIHSWQNLI